MEKVQMVDIKTPKSIAESYVLRMWEHNDLKAIDDLMHPEVIIHSLLGDFQGTEFMKRVVLTYLVAFPDLTINNTAIICENERVVVQWEARGTHRGEFKGVKPTGKIITYEGVTVYRINEAKIVEYWAYLDMRHILLQMH